MDKTHSLKGRIRTISLVSTNSLSDDVRTTAENSRTNLNAFYFDCMNCSAIDIRFLSWEVSYLFLPPVLSFVRSFVRSFIHLYIQSVSQSFLS